MPKIIVEGTISAGKTTLVKCLSKLLNAIPVIEEVLQDGDPGGCPYLEEYYKYINDPEGSIHCSVVFKTQVWFLSSRFNKYRTMCKDGRLYIGDRSLWGDYCFARTQHKMKRMSHIDYENYLHLWGTMVSLLEKPDVFVYVKADPEFLMKRIEKRGREIEKAITLEYLKELNDCYDDLVNGVLSLQNVCVYNLAAQDIEGDGKVNIDSPEFEKLMDCLWKINKNKVVV